MIVEDLMIRRVRRIVLSGREFFFFFFMWTDGWCPREDNRIQLTWEPNADAKCPLRTAATAVRIIHSFVGQDGLQKSAVFSCLRWRLDSDKYHMQTPFYIQTDNVNYIPYPQFIWVQLNPPKYLLLIASNSPATSHRWLTLCALVEILVHICILTQEKW